MAEGYLLALGAAEVGAVGVLRKLFIEALSAESVAALGQEARHEIPRVGELPTAGRAHQLFKHGLFVWLSWHYKTIIKSFKLVLSNV